MNENNNVLQEYQKRIIDLCDTYTTDPSKILEFIQFKSQFYQYSLNNTMLIYGQRPKASFVQSYAAWNKMGANVLKGEKGLKIYTPVKATYILNPETSKYELLSVAKRENPKLYEAYKEGMVESREKVNFRIGNVFDISQTNFPKERYPELYSMGYSSEQHDLLIKGMIDYAGKEHGIDVNSADLESISLRGLSYRGMSVVEINERLESTQFLSTLNHEIGHQLLHENTNKPIHQIEFEADVFSIMLDYHMGIDVTDARKEHVVACYKNILKECENENSKEVLDELFDNVFKTYSQEISKIDVYVDKYLPKDKQQHISKSKNFEIER